MFTNVCYAVAPCKSGAGVQWTAWIEESHGEQPLTLRSAPSKVCVEHVLSRCATEHSLNLIERSMESASGNQGAKAEAEDKKAEAEALLQEIKKDLLDHYKSWVKMLPYNTGDITPTTLEKLRGLVDTLIECEFSKFKKH